MSYTCEKCNAFVENDYGSRRFCSRTCANARTWTKEDREKKSLSSRISNKVKVANVQIGLDRMEVFEYPCATCLKMMRFLGKSSRRKCCSSECVRKNPACGGLRHGSGRSRKGWYRGLYCQSTWELAFVIWCIDHDISIKRCDISFQYTFEGKQRLYYPDFIVGDYVVEIKGFDTEQTRAKRIQVPHVVNLFEEDLKPVFDYVRVRYTSNLETLFES